MTSPEPLASRQEAASHPPSGFPAPGDQAAALTNKGWAALEQGEPRQAIQLFRRALRLQPDYARAQSGIVEALKAQHPLYRRLLMGFFWMSRFPPAIQIAVMLFAFFALRLISSLAASSVAWAPYLWPLLLAIFFACILLGLASPLFDVVLRLDPIGRQSLSDDQRRGASLLIANLLLPLPVLFVSLATSNGLGIVVWILLSMTALPGSAIFRCAPGWPRWTVVALTLGLWSLIVPLFAAAFELPIFKDIDRSQWIALCVYAIIIAQLVATALLAIRRGPANS